MQSGAALTPFRRKSPRLIIQENAWFRRVARFYVCMCVRAHILTFSRCVLKLGKKISTNEHSDVAVIKPTACGGDPDVPSCEDR